MPTAALAFLAGCIAVQQLPALPTSGWVWSVFLLSILLVLVRRARLAGIFLLALSLAMLEGRAGLNQRLPEAIESLDLGVEGTIATIPQKRGPAVRFEFDVERVLSPERAIAWEPDRIRLSWYRDAPELRAGQRWRLTVRLKRPYGTRNPGGLDYEGWLFQDGVDATGHVRSGTDNRLVAAGSAFLSLPSLRQGLYDRITESLPEGSNRGIISALTLGERGPIERAEWELYLATGVNHLLAISGMNIGLVAGLVYWLAGWLWRRSYRLCLWLPAQKAATLAGLVTAVGYALLSGFSIPARRALVMLVVVFGAQLLSRHVRPTHVLALALLLVLLHDTLAVLSPGFWLSFAAVAIILFAISDRGAREGKLRAWTKMQWALSIGLLPLSLMFFHRLSIISPIANLLAVPWVGLLVTPLSLVALPVHVVHEGAGELFFRLADGMLALMNMVLGFLSQLPHAQLRFAPVGWTVVPALVGAALLLAPRGFPGRGLAAVFMAPLFLLRPEPPRKDEFELSMLDVGQGLAVVVRTARHALVFDTGARLSDDFDMGAAVVLPFLRMRGVAEIDALVISHGDNDHVGGLESVLAGIPTKRVIVSAPIDIPQGTSWSLCAQGQRWSWDGIDFTMLHPSPGWQGSANDLSCVLRVAGPGGVALLTGDIGRTAELHLLGPGKSMLDADAVLVPHHGSRSSSTEAFIDAVTPAFSLVSAGYLSRYGHPHADIVERYDRAGSKVLISAQLGTVSLAFDSDGPAQVIERYRPETKKYWHSSWRTRP